MALNDSQAFSGVALLLVYSLGVSYWSKARLLGRNINIYVRLRLLSKRCAHPCCSETAKSQADRGGLSRML